MRTCARLGVARRAGGEWLARGKARRAVLGPRSSVEPLEVRVLLAGSSIGGTVF
jgi:hypothetical protein